MEARSDRTLARALAAYREGRFRGAAALAAAAYRIEARPVCLGLLAASAARSGDFVAAVRIVRGIMAAGQHPEP